MDRGFDGDKEQEKTLAQSFVPVVKFPFVFVGWCGRDNGSSFCAFSKKDQLSQFVPSNFSIVDSNLEVVELAMM